jgi:hypothetical protein
MPMHTANFIVDRIARGQKDAKSGSRRKPALVRRLRILILRLSNASEARQ